MQKKLHIVGRQSSGLGFALLGIFVAVLARTFVGDINEQQHTERQRVYGYNSGMNAGYFQRNGSHNHYADSSKCYFAHLAHINLFLSVKQM
jgi:hypothetical protein